MWVRLSSLFLPVLLAACAPSARQELPEEVTLKNVGHEPQRLNNCGPVNAMIVLNYHGHNRTQAQAAAALKDSPGDVEVSTREVADYLETFGLKTLIRYGGDLNVVRKLLAQKLPVIVQQRFQEGDRTAVRGSCRVMKLPSEAHRNPRAGGLTATLNTGAFI